MESVIGRFESAWRMGGRPSIEVFLDDAPDQRGALLVELAHAELELRLRAGERARVEEYLTRFPELERDPAIVAELIRAEFELRRRDDANVDAAEYRARFPKLGDALPTRATPPPQRPARFPLRFNCPHCRNPIEVVAIDRDEEMICPSCGSSFRLDSDLTQSWNKDRLPALGRFELIEAVGRGAFGTVYRARDMQLQRMVAVKVPRSGHLTTDEDEDRFVKEARNAAQLKHPGIVQVYEVGHSDTFPYIVSELVEGITLADALTGRRFGFRESADLVAQVANALEHAHKQGVVHRDLKPSNIMLTA